jgi:hypothetical protein
MRRKIADRMSGFDTDVLLILKDCDEVGAKNRIDLYCGEVKEIAKLRAKDTAYLKSEVVFVHDVNQEFFEHFVRTADRCCIFIEVKKNMQKTDYSGRWCVISVA